MTKLYFLLHGMQVIPELENPYNEDFRALHNSMELVASQIETLQPKTIVLLTPHGYNLDERYLVYLHEKFSGSFFRIDPHLSVVHGELVETKNWNGDVEVANELFDAMKEKDLPVEGLTLGYPGYPLMLSWGSTVPLYYIGRSSAKLVIIGIPRSRHDKIADIQSQLHKISQIIVDMSKMERDIVFVFSGDLSHVHDTNGPYGFHESGKPFDEYVQQWAKNPSSEIFDKLLELQPTALACGMANMSILQGIFEQTRCQNRMLEYDVPTYFGMPVMMWEM